MNVVIYARYSTHKQDDGMSIEGQLKECRKYANRNNHTIIHEYIDKAFSAKTDKRPQFQRMISDSSNRQFSAILVYQLDRFSRNRYDSAIYKKELENNGVRLYSVQENIAEGSSGILTESMIEAFAEYFSVQLSEKVSRGMYLNAENCKYNGGSYPLGFRIDENNHYQIDETTAPITKTIFQKYADGETIKNITDWLNSKGIKTGRGNVFTRTSLQRTLRNKKYIGTYIFGDVEIENGIPRIISDELFYEVQEKLKSNKHRNGGHYKADEEYLLTGKLFCGHCKEKMVGTSGTSKQGSVYRYYKCYTAQSKIEKCSKKNVPKDYIENRIVNDCYTLLIDDIIQLIAERVVALSQDESIKLEIQRMEKLISSKEKNIETLIDNLENGIIVERISKRIKERENEISELKRQIALEKNKLLSLTIDEVVFFLENLRKGNINRIKYKKLFINTLIHKVYLYDDNYTVFFNLGNDTASIDESRLPSLTGTCIDEQTEYQKASNFNSLELYFFLKECESI